MTQRPRLNRDADFFALSAFAVLAYIASKYDVVEIEEDLDRVERHV